MGAFFLGGKIMIYGLATIKGGVIFTSKSLDMVLEEMGNYPDSFIVEIEEKQKKVFEDS